jgi:uncharacterized protein YfdQ (DUF2303 family)
MTIEKEAIQHLQKSANMLELDEKLQEQETKSNLMMVPSGFEISDLERYMEFRSSYRFKFSTRSIEDFVNYSKEFDKKGAKCFVDSDNVSAKVIFDLGTEELPLHQRNQASLELRKTAAYSKLLSLSDSHFDQRSASDFIEDFSDFMTIKDSEGKEMTNAQAANAINKITIEGARSLTSEVGDFSSSMSAMEKEEVKGSSRFPSKIIFQCVPFLGLSKREFSVRVAVLTGGERPKISFRVLQLEPNQEDIIEEFKEKLVGMFVDLETYIFIGVND